MGDYARDWALVDVETSGLIARRDRVLSVAVVTVGPDGERTGEFSTLLNPGCDPGPVDIHGLTTERLLGAPTFDLVAEEMAAMLQGRVLVAHNAQFDYDFLAYEFARARRWLPVSQRLCTLALSRQVDPPTEDLKLGTLAAHYGVPQRRAHDALDDTRVLAGVLRASLREAERLALPLPLVTCPPRAESQFTPKPPKTPCAYRNPGRLTPGGPLRQGMKIAVSGETTLARAELTGRGVAAGLNMMTCVSHRTSVLVTNEPASDSTKVRRADAEGVPVIDEDTFLKLLGDVRAGTSHQAPAPKPSASALPVPAPRRPEPVAAGGPLAGQRVLVLGGPHAEAAAARTRVVERGGSAAVNLSRSVTAVVVLAGGERDRRMRRVVELGIPVRDAQWLGEPTGALAALTAVRPAEEPATAVRSRTPLVLPRGGVVDLPAPPSGTPAPTCHVTAAWEQPVHGEVDVVAFVLDEDEQVAFDEDFVFYGAPENPAGTVRLLTGGPAEQTIAVDLASLPPSAHKVVVAAAVDGDLAFGDVGAVQVALAPGGSAAAPSARATLDAATSERTLLLAELYRRGPVWRFRAVGQGYDHGLAALARGYGVDVAD
ncbi:MULTISPECIES: TerD family protein [Streptomyces]|uniref:DNA polymerase III n=1 Tax=Streptomyces odorifer TaxID=53450 RepID=A0A7Y6F2N3_9ACTN|nr:MULTISPECIES: TerD family protein [Streptomyces]NUV38346.1 DNA polymerase III [Streptomyces sp. KAI-27]NUV51125.1 DNA polymerase III [Streptomyces sp. CAI-78]QDD60706.1 DNA polymerase III [Streptomyces albidoflavus]MDH6191346.1 DNA polymerase-3 subunit epsilon [Streptomyces sp. CZ24]NUV29699.1 DNA polymerase III [Streptomyces odorifer]